MIDGKIPPSAPEIEAAVLGVCIQVSDAIMLPSDILKPEMFYIEANRIIFKTLLDLYQNRKSISILSVREELKKSGKLEDVGGAYYLSELTSKISNSAHLEYHSMIVYEKYLHRQLMKIGQDAIVAGSSQDDVFNSIDKISQNIFNLTNIDSPDDVDFGKLITQAQIEIEAKESGAIPPGIMTGIEDVDRIITGFKKTDLVIIGARPSMGKTAYMLWCAYQIASMGIPVGIFSLEMSRGQLVNRIICAATGIDSTRLQTGRLNKDEIDLLNRLAPKIGALPIFIDHRSSPSVMQIRTKARKWVEQKKVGIIFMDYLQLVGGSQDKGQNREQFISQASRSLKGTAKDLDIPMVVISQLNRSNKDRGDKRPVLSDLRDSGAIEQDADLVMFLHRPEYYGSGVDESGESNQGLCEVIIAKHRNGPIGEAKLHFLKEFGKFTTFGSNYYEPKKQVYNDFTEPKKILPF